MTPAPSAAPIGKFAYSQTAGAFSKLPATQTALPEQPHLPSTQMSRPVSSAVAAQSSEVAH